MDLFGCVESRHSTRHFVDTKEVTPEVEGSILAAAIRAPSAGNIQAYGIAAVRNAEMKEALCVAALDQPFVSEAPLCLVFWADPSLNETKYAERGSMYAIQDATLAAGYAQLAANALGLSSVWVGAFSESEVQSILHLTKKQVPVAIISIGYQRGPSPKRTPRRPINETVQSYL
ncbi:Coenzyme F420:L-glutamate ligase [Pelomyxa schiedti]|nr:Coenzyme F420:L-glutamate ligase [Pelomyxa schiedti]